MVTVRRAYVVPAWTTLNEGLNGGDGALVEEFNAEEIVRDSGSLDDSEGGRDALEA